MKKCIAIFNDTTEYGIDITGFCTMTDKEAELYENLLNDISWGFDYDIENFTLQYSNGEDLLSKIDFKDVTNEEYKSFDRLFGGTFGTFISLAHLESIIKEDEEEEIEDEDEEDDY